MVQFSSFQASDCSTFLPMCVSFGLFVAFVFAVFVLD